MHLNFQYDVKGFDRPGITSGPEVATIGFNKRKKELSKRDKSSSTAASGRISLSLASSSAITELALPPSVVGVTL